ncbi:MAG: hypothetical protein ACI4R8_05005 [Candidatus Caccovivens sp.]
MLFVYIIIMIAILGVAIFFICKEYIKKDDSANEGSRGIIKNKKTIENMVANVESIIVYADGNDVLCHRLVELKDDIRFFNPSTNSRVAIVDTKIANKLDDLKIMVAKDNTQETCFRLLEEVEAYVLERKKEEKN